MSSRRLRYRFTFFQRQFVSHLIVSLLILGLLGSGFAYYIKQQALTATTNDLIIAGKVIARQLAREEEEPTVPLQSYRYLLTERKISFILLNKAGEVSYRDPKMPGPLRSQAFLDGLRARINNMKDNQSFIVDRNTAEPLVVVNKPIHLKKQKEDMYLFVFTPLSGFQETLDSFDRSLLHITALVFLLAVGVSWLISRNISKTIHSLRQATRQIAGGNYAERLTVGRSDELGDLSHDFNSMAGQLEASSLKLQQYEKRRHRFITDMAHELRTPLTSIRGIVEALKNGLVTRPEDQQKFYGIIEKETFRLIRLINELLDMKKIENGLIRLDKRRNSLKELMDIVVESLEVLIEAQQLQIAVECDEALSVYGDYDRLIQIMINLVKNSIQFTEYGAIRLKGSDTETDTVIEISDTGRGMTSEELSLIWERFYKADPSRAKNSSETGLGLSIVKQLVEAHQGSIQVESTPGVGSVFVIRLPKDEAAASFSPASPAQV